MPARTPRTIIDKLHREITAILRLPDVRERLSHEGGEVAGSTPDQFAAHIEREIAKWTTVVKTANIRAESRAHCIPEVQFALGTPLSHLIK